MIEEPADLIIGFVMVVVITTALGLFGPRPAKHQMQPNEQVIETRGPTLYDI